MVEQNYFVCKDCHSALVDGPSEPQVILRLGPARLLDTALEARFFGSGTHVARQSGDKNCGLRHGVVCRRLTRLPATLVISLARVTQVLPYLLHHLNLTASYQQQVMVLIATHNMNLTFAHCTVD